MLKKFLVGFGREWRENPLKVAASIAIMVGVFIALYAVASGSFNLKVKYDDAEVHVTTQAKQ